MVDWWTIVFLIALILIFFLACASLGRYWGIRQERQQSILQIGNRDAILDAVRFAATEFLTSNNWESTTQQVLIKLQEATQATRIQIFQRRMQSDGSYASEYKLGLPEDMEDTNTHFPLITANDIKENYRERILRGEMVILPLREMSGTILEIAKQQGSISALIMPIMVEGNAWGSLTLTSATREHWNVSERDALHAAADILGAAIQRQRDAEALIKREKILGIVSIAARRFLRSGNWEDHIQHVLEELGSVTIASRVYISSIEINESGDAIATLRYSWATEGIDSQINDNSLQHFPISKHLPRLYNLMQRREVVYGIVSEFPPEERIAFEAADIQSVLAVPIIVASQFWGFIGFDECTYPRIWTSAEREAIKAAAEIIGGGIQRDNHERILRDKTAELTERNQDLETFNRTIAHDLRSPLHTITNALIMMRQRYMTEFSDEAVDTLVNIEIRTKHLHEMIDQLWWLTRLHDPTEEISPVEMDLAIHSALIRYADRAKERDVTIKIGENIPNAMGHWRWIVEVFANLISNAIKFSDKNADNPYIEINGTLEQNTIRYTVTDNGIGISKENQEKIFEIFERLDKSSTSGSGLGLSLVKRMITKMEGEIGVESDVGQGATFWFTLPKCPPSFMLRS